MACAQICPVSAITVEDRILDYRARIDEEKCVHCDLCRKVCPNHERPAFKRPYLWKQGWALDPHIRERASSGGFAPAIQKSFIQNGGIVCSCVFQNGEFVFALARDANEVDSFGGSKYVKSNPGEMYRQIRHLLKEGRKVLFVGLPCQVAGIRNFCGGYPDLLYTVDLICHGSPSPEVLKSFLRDKKLAPGELTDIIFRSKKDYARPGEEIIVPDGIREYYTMCFRSGVSLTDNCYECVYAGLERISDLTLGDAWGTGLGPGERAKGISLALCMTQKGEELLRGAALYLTDVDLEKVAQVNTQLSHPVEKPPEHEALLQGIRQGKSFDSMIRRLYPKLYWTDKAKIILHRLGLYRRSVFQKYRIRIIKKGAFYDKTGKKR